MSIVEVKIATFCFATKGIVKGKKKFIYIHCRVVDSKPYIEGMSYGKSNWVGNGYFKDYFNEEQVEVFRTEMYKTWDKLKKTLIQGDFIVEEGEDV